MSFTKPLSYLCYEPILVNMSADQRIRLAIHSSAIRNIDRMVPLKIKSLILNPLELQLDGATYEIDFIRRNHLSKTNQLMSNRVDRIHFLQKTKYPENREIEVTREAEKGLIRMIENSERIVLQNEYKGSPTQPKTTETLQLLISHLLKVRTELDMVRPLDHTDYLGFSESSGKVESLEYTRSACSTMEYLFKKIFGNRELIYLDHMGVGVPELPKETRERKIDGLTIPSIFELLQEFNFKVNQLSSQSKDLKIESPMLQNIQKLTISGNMSHTDIRKLQFNNVHFLDNIRPFSQLAVSYHSGSKPMEIGFCWTFDIQDRGHATVENFFSEYSIPGVVLIDEVFVRENSETRGTRYPLKIVYQAKDNASELHVYCKRTTRDKWMTVLEVLPIGS